MKLISKHPLCPFKTITYVLNNYLIAELYHNSSNDNGKTCIIMLRCSFPACICVYMPCGVLCLYRTHAHTPIGQAFTSYITSTEFMPATGFNSNPLLFFFFPQNKTQSRRAWTGAFFSWKGPPGVCCHLLQTSAFFFPSRFFFFPHRNFQTDWFLCKHHVLDADGLLVPCYRSLLKSNVFLLCELQEETKTLLKSSEAGVRKQGSNNPVMEHEIPLLIWVLGTLTLETEFWFHDESCKWKHCSNKAACSRMFSVSWNVGWGHNWGSGTAIYWCCEGTGPAALFKKDQQIRVKWEPAGWLEVTERVWRAVAPLYLLSKHMQHDYETQTGSRGNDRRRCSRFLLRASLRVTGPRRKTFGVCRIRTVSIQWSDGPRCVVAVWHGWTRGCCHVNWVT